MAKTSSETQRRKSRAARKGKWPPRGTGTTVLTYPCPTASRVSVAVGGCARGTGKAGENDQYSGAGRQLSLDKTVGSRVWRHTQGSSGRPASDLGWGIVLEDGLRGRYRLGHRPVVLLRTETAQCTVRPT